MLIISAILAERKGERIVGRNADQSVEQGEVRPINKQVLLITLVALGLLIAVVVWR